MHWLWSNKEWLFSGLGVAIAGLLYRFLIRNGASRSAGIVFADRKGTVLGSPIASGSNISQTINIVASGTSSPAPRSTTSPIYEERPTPDEIFGQLLSLPIYQRPAARESYLGLGVCWRVTLQGMRELSDSERLIFNTDATHDLS